MMQLLFLFVIADAADISNLGVPDDRAISNKFFTCWGIRLKKLLYRIRSVRKRKRLGSLQCDNPI